MLKKLLSLSLVAVMLSVAALAAPGASENVITPTYAAEPVVKKESYNGHSMELLYVTQKETDGVVSQTVGECSWASNVTDLTENKWGLAKIKIGNWENLTSLTVNINVGVYSVAKYYGHIMPLTKADYDAAKAVAGTTTPLSYLLERPIDNEENALVSEPYSRTKAGWTMQNLQVTFDDCSVFTDEYYQDGYIYVAFQVKSDTTGITKPRFQFHASSSGSRYGYWYLTAEGTFNNDFSESVITWDGTTGAYTVETATTSGTAMLIAASFNGTTMVDAKVATINAEEAVKSVISGTIEDLQEGEEVKIFLWDKTTLAPAITPATF